MYLDESLVVQQLRYTGMLETVRIRRSGYGAKYTFQVLQIGFILYEKLFDVDVKWTATMLKAPMKMVSKSNSHPNNLTLAASLFFLFFYLNTNVFVSESKTHNLQRCRSSYCSLMIKNVVDDKCKIHTVEYLTLRFGRVPS